MTRTANRMGNRMGNRNRMIALVASTALVTMALGGCATKAAPRADLSASKAQTALARGKTDQAVAHAEAAVLGEPRNAAYRAMLGAAYMEAGRFQSAATSFDDALELGDESARTALSYALAQTAAGDARAALAVLEDWRDDIPAADLGLALALAGQPDQGVHILSNALRGGENTAKVRQNLAYAFALQGNWRAARVMAAEDVPADQLDERIGEWAQMSRPEDYHARVAALLSVPRVGDSGQPVELALVNHPTVEQLAVEAAAYVAPEAAPQAEVAYTGAELPPLIEAPAPAPAPVIARVDPGVARPANFEQAFAAPAPTGATPMQMAENAVQFMARPVVQTMPSRYGAAPEERPRSVAPRVAGRVTGRAIAAAPASAAPSASGDHLVQLGSFSSEAGARRAWGIYAARYPQLSGYEMVITQAVVRGKAYWRVSAGGFQRTAARSMCSNVKAGGNGCIAWAEGRPLPGAVDRGARMAAR